MSNQLVKKNPAEGYQNVFPKTWIDAIKDKESGVSLQEILQGFNMYFLSYNGSRALTRCKVPSVLRKEGLWITYVLYDHTVVTEWYNSDQIDDNSWSMDSNWRVASNFLVGDVSVSADGYWVINGEKTEAKAQGEQGVTPLLRVGANNKLQVSYNTGKAWKDISDYIVPRFRWNQGTGTSAGTIQISMDLGKTWTNLSNEITNNLRISRYIGINESLPTSGIAEGTIYMKGPYYNESDTSNANPIYRMWVYAWKGNTLAWQDNGEFTSISARVVQERGNSTTEVMSQDAVTKELTKLSLDMNGALYPNYFEDKYVDKDGNIVDAQYWGVTSLIPYSGGNVYWLAGYTSGSRCLVFYDVFYNPIRGAFYGASLEEIIIQQEEIPADAKYIRASYLLDAESSYVKIGEVVVWDSSKKSDGLIARVENLEYLKNEIAEIKPNNTTITKDIKIGQDGYYIDTNGNRQPYNSYGISGIIHLSKGDVLSANITASATAYLCKYNGSDTSYIVILYAPKTINSFTYTAEEDVDVVMCGAKSSFSTYTIQMETIKAASEYSVEQLSVRVTKLEESFSRISLVNPYAGVDYNNPVLAQSHEHSYTKDKLESAYNRGIRLFAVSHYQPAVPRYPLSKTPLTWMDYKSREAVDNGDYELVERTQTTNTGITQLNVDAGTITTDDIPQIANAERPYIHSDSHFYNEHFNILGLLWGDPGVMLANNESSTSWKKEHSLETISKIQELLGDETMWQFGSQYAFGTINHNKSISDTKAMLDTLPQIFKAMELFNQGYSEGWNQEFRDTYDAILRQGYRIWGTAVVDWQGDWASWSYTTDTEKAEWKERYNTLPADEQAQYGSAENYYMQNGRFKFDRGANVLLMPNGYESLSPALQAKEGIKAYIQGRYYMVGVGNYSMRMAIDGNTIIFRVSDFCPKIKIITANGVSELTNTDTARYTPSETDKYVRFEAKWDDGDFIFSNPIFIDLIN